ncbi:killer cell lectin-like receptor subfamily F member 1, partial [Biomphalaria pfeifferi]
KSSHLYTVKTLEKFMILQEKFRLDGVVWVALNDMATESVFRWVHDNTICNQTCQSMIFQA